MTLRANVCLAIAAALALSSASIAAPAAPVGGVEAPDARSIQAYNQALRTTQSRINSSPDQARALAMAVQAKDDNRIRALLIRNGFPSKSLMGARLSSKIDGVIDLNDKKQKITITFEGGCCPFWIIITVR